MLSVLLRFTSLIFPYVSSSSSSSLVPDTSYFLLVKSVTFSILRHWFTSRLKGELNIYFLLHRFWRCFLHCGERRVWRYQMGNQNPYIEKGQTTQWPKEKVQKDKQRSTRHTHKTKDRVTRTPLKIEVNSCRWSGGVSSSCSTIGTLHVILVINPVISHEWGKDRQVEHIRCHLWHRYSIAVNQVMMATVKFRSDDFNLTKRNP